ncbi:type I-C CRISPR-associated protein Cas8c/Csd1 [Crossiella sp. SN42]|uniref:type I-C CRISPR-associated protein Cas8c/Csd1 n=1 Tax=Crossiella sp. SN42 TaxID=2944808 RepID=UPI00207C8D08|nr:type I-C CRISPR-associated protein Cas8c/Csd1 [Crossiella sp. SN42]MCO1575483.1 type I-C CRISPR-associated protein Cas8c/Csd1 [Crossiella sp. SN42]
MLIQRLVEYAQRRSPAARPFHRGREFRWRLELTLDGQAAAPLLPLQSADDTRGNRGQLHTVPTAVRTVGVAANLAADDAQYVLGHGDETTKPERVAKCHHAFVELTQRWAHSPHAQHDPVPAAIAAFFQRGQINQVLPEEPVAAKDGILITVAGEPAYQAPSVVPFWTEEVGRRKGGGHTGLCLVCGQHGPLLDTVPGKIPARWIPGATNDAALISVNERVFGYDLTTGLGHTPICMSCGDALNSGLLGVLSSPDSASYGGQDSRIAWWATNPDTEVSARLLLKPDPARITKLIQSVHAGQKPDRRVNTEKFYSLTVGGNIARVMVRDWIDMPLADLDERISRWFTDLEITSRWDSDLPRPSIRTLALATGRWITKTKRYAEFDAKNAARPHTVQRDLLRAAIHGTPVPGSLLVHLLHRIRTDGHLDETRAALIRLSLNRLPYLEGIPMPGLDETNTQPGYLAGRTFALLERIQYEAHRPRTPQQTDRAAAGEKKTSGQVNTTYGDRFFASASANPRAALVAGRRDAVAWLRKLRRTKPALASFYDKKLNELFELYDVNDNILLTANLEQQALFMLGYHHQRARRTEAKDPLTDADPA